MQTTLKFLPLLMLFALLAACRPVTPPPTPQPTVDLTAVYAQTLGTAVARVTQDAAPPATPTLLPGELPVFSFKDYNVIFTQGGSLYAQSGENVPVTLAQAPGSDFFHERIISSDGQKIVFLRGKTPRADIASADVYTVNADGSGQSLLIPPVWLAKLAKGTGRAPSLPVFIPGTHQILFETSFCQTPDKSAPCSVGIFRADTDSGEIVTILLPGPALPPSPQARFNVSPDGKLIALASAGHVDLFDVDGALVRGGVFIYTPSTAETLFPALFWLPDSSGLIAALPTDAFHIGAYNKDVAAYAFWRYTLADSRAESIPISPSPINLQGEADAFRVSPDGLWLLYGGNGAANSDLYLANLRDGKVQRIGDNPQPAFSWSPDSRHFFGQNFAGLVGERVAQMTKKTFDVLGWIDATHFICQYCGETDSKPHVAEIVGDELRFYRLPPAMEKDAYLLIVPK